MKTGDGKPVFQDASSWRGTSNMEGFFAVLDEMEKKGITAEITRINKEEERDEAFCGN